MEQLTGTLIKKEQTQVISDRLSKRGFLLRIGDEYKQDIYIIAVKKACEVLDKFNEGDIISAKINLRGNEHNGKHYNSIEAWFVAKHEPVDPSQDQRVYQD